MSICFLLPSPEIRARAALFCLLVLLSGMQSSAEPVGNAFPLADGSIAETLLRLPDFDLQSRPDLLQSLDRYLRSNLGTTRYFQLVRQFELQDRSDELLNLALTRVGTTPGTWAAETLVTFGKRNQIEQAVLSPQTDRSVAAVRAIGSVGDVDAHTFLTQALLGAELSPETLTAIATALARQPQGEQFLAETVVADKLPAQLSFTVANLLHISQNPAHRGIATQHLPLPKTKSGKPLPPLKELVKRSGDPVAGRTLFFSKAQCATCHRVTEEGKFVGPDLTEIGSKLSKQVLYTSILDPSAAISHNYENHELLSLDGKIETGILLSRSEAKIEIKNAEGIVRSFPASEIESLRKLPISLMPAGIEKQLTAEELVDLVEYLLSLKQPH